MHSAPSALSAAANAKHRIRWPVPIWEPASVRKTTRTGSSANLEQGLQRLAEQQVVHPPFEHAGAEQREHLVINGEQALDIHRAVGVAQIVCAEAQDAAREQLLQQQSLDLKLTDARHILQQQERPGRMS